ncbi:protein disulfide-isomerase [Oikeobacillus pervagus]|uniref:Protein disulfide-isomerase n=1 Tax=Oikeobacillus pervagus TaxID=1325931 RepID=A0AAJ1WKI1_9BACI|nr:DsbA family oxidoreductase [Oikeobacillus pervagus]MDQ0216628.1 protein disulfide-isomerase [Oikeobacillus pervagus]
MKIEVWSDFVCPFCYIGKRRLEKALENFPQKSKVEVVYRSYELDPNAKKDYQESIHQILASKYGISLEKATKMNEDIGKQAASVGLEYHFDTMKPTNTFHAHRLVKFAEEKGKEMTERLLRAYFTDSKHLGNDEELAQLAVELGFDYDEVIRVLESDQYSEAVRADEEMARKIGVQGVPFFVLNQKYAVSGAQPTEIFEKALQKVWKEENTVSTIETLSNESGAGAVCTDDGCQIPNQKEV